ncbi:nuclease-related domain-containing protein [Photobacterium toruni]|uniref:nuclease-related domain-containing protein n=1 Tax=Photobacterium toruni TaxID=1935446 RepID=UPI002E185ECC|nr:nuclease-related domain-containing protein [Photobacterium toruni]
MPTDLLSWFAYANHPFVYIVLLAAIGTGCYAARSNHLAREHRRKKSQRAAIKRGEKFEADLVNLIANQLPVEGVILYDVVLTGLDDRTTQIDVIVILPSGIWVIEAKNLSGLILGKMHEKRWIQILANGKRRYPFQNPFNQNYRHLKVLEEVTDMACRPVMHSRVVFGGRATWGNENGDVPFGLYLTPEPLLKELCQPRPTVLTLTEMEQICGKIAVANKAGSLAKKQHIQQLKQAR